MIQNDLGSFRLEISSFAPHPKPQTRTAPIRRFFLVIFDSLGDLGWILWQWGDIGVQSWGWFKIAKNRWKIRLKRKQTRLQNFQIWGRPSLVALPGNMKWDCFSAQKMSLSNGCHPHRCWGMSSSTTSGMASQLLRRSELQFWWLKKSWG